MIVKVTGAIFGCGHDNDRSIVILLDAYRYMYEVYWTMYVIEHWTLYEFLFKDRLEAGGLWSMTFFGTTTLNLTSHSIAEPFFWFSNSQKHARRRRRTMPYVQKSTLKIFYLTNSSLLLSDFKLLDARANSTRANACITYNMQGACPAIGVIWHHIRTNSEVQNLSCFSLRKSM